MRLDYSGMYLMWQSSSLKCSSPPAFNFTSSQVPFAYEHSQLHSQVNLEMSTLPEGWRGTVIRAPHKYCTFWPVLQVRYFLSLLRY
jgi:hypothetical protein